MPYTQLILRCTTSPEPATAAPDRCKCYNYKAYGGYSSAAERLTVAQDVVGSIPTSRPNGAPTEVIDVSSADGLSPRVSSAMTIGDIFVGCSGWAYTSWKPDFYPSSVPAKKLLEYYATRLNSVEVNYTFRSLPSATTVGSWLASTRSDFRFSFKAPQRVTHILRLKNCGEALDRFAQAITAVHEAGRLGLILFQLPPNMKADADRLSAFLDDARPMGFRISFEFRHPSWFDEPTFSLLRDHSAALCVAESDELTTPDEVTAPFTCYRLRRTGYSAADLQTIAGKLKLRATHGDVFAYFRHEEQPTGALQAASVLKEIRGA